MTNDTPQYRAAVKLKALLEAMRGGAGRIYWWGWEGEGDDPGVTANGATLVGVDQPNGGEATVVYDALRAFAEVFPVGATAYELEFEGEGVDGMATEFGFSLLNVSDVAKTVCLGDTVYSLAPFGFVVQKQ